MSSRAGRRRKKKQPAIGARQEARATTSDPQPRTEVDVGGTTRVELTTNIAVVEVQALVSVTNFEPGPSEPAPAKTAKVDPLTAWTFVKEAGIYVVLAAFSIAIFDLFGLEAGQRLTLQDGFNQVFADFYEMFPAGRGYVTPRPAEVAVVSWREADLRGKTWPLPYAEHARALRDIAAARPRAVFIDVLFKDRRREGVKSHKASLRPLVDAIRDLAAAGVPVYLLNEGGCADGEVIDWLLPVRKTTPQYVPPRAVSTKRIGEDEEPTDEDSETPGAHDHDLDGVDRKYFLFADRESLKPESVLVPECATAPLRMHLDQRKRERSTRRYVWPFERSAAWPSNVHSPAVLDLYREPLSIFWGGCRDDAMPTVVRLGRWFLGRGARRKPECAPFPTLTREQLATAEKVHLREKLVVYGTDFDAAADRVATAIHERPVPGAVANAMALDNLQRWGTRYLYHPQPTTWLPDGLRRPDLVMLSIGALFFPFVRRRQKRTIVDRLFDRFAPGRATPLRGRMVAATRTARSVVLVPLVILVAVAPLVFVFSRLPLGVVAPHAFAWGFVAAAFALREALEGHRPPATTSGGSTS